MFKPRLPLLMLIALIILSHFDINPHKSLIDVGEGDTFIRL